MIKLSHLVNDQSHNDKMINFVVKIKTFDFQRSTVTASSYQISGGF